MKKNERTSVVIVNPGGITHHQAVRIAPLEKASCNIDPQLVRSCAPNPKNEMFASRVTASPAAMVPSVTARGNRLGAM